MPLNPTSSLGDMISRDGASASITETLDKREAGLKDTLDDIMDLAENISLNGMNSAMAAIIQSQIVTKLIHNCESHGGTYPKTPRYPK